MAPTPNSAARRAAAGGPGGGEATLDGIARAAYRTLRTAENLAAHAALCTAPPHPQPVCVTALAAAYVSGAAGVCRSAVFVPEWPRAPLWAMGDARLFAAALGNLLANAVQLQLQPIWLVVVPTLNLVKVFLTLVDFVLLVQSAMKAVVLIINFVVVQVVKEILVNHNSIYHLKMNLCVALDRNGLKLFWIA